MRKLRIFAAVLLLITLAVGILSLTLARRKSQYQVGLANGAVLTLKQVVCCATNFSYTHNSRGRILDFLTPVLPTFILQKFPPGAMGGFGFGTDGSTNLFVITSLRYQPGSWSGIHRLRVSDGTNRYDACWGSNTLGVPGETVNGWQVRAFPRRSKTLTLEFMGPDKDSKAGQVVARFSIPNPAPGEFPQWAPGPTVLTNGNLAVRLEKFRSGDPMDPPWGLGDPANQARKTGLLFAFEEDGHPTGDWSVQKVTLSDATGNCWSPYLDLIKPGFAWAQGGRVEFFGALWPGEQAWKLKVEVTRTRGVSAADQFSFEAPLPGTASITTLTNQWEHDGVTIDFVGLASPNTDHPGDFRWIGKWWGEPKDRVHSLALRATPGLQGHRLQLLSATDQNGKEVPLLQHNGRDAPEQALFLRPDAEAQSLKLTFALTRSRFLEFVARPEFAEFAETNDHILPSKP